MIIEYIDAYKKIFDYKSKSRRKDFNYFILCFICISLLLVVFFNLIYLYIVPMIYTGASISTPQITDIQFDLFIKKISFWFGIINAVPLLALIKRRINDINENKSKIYFISLIIIYIIVRYWKHIFAYVIMSIIKLNPIQFIDLILYYGFFMIAIICNIICIVSLLLLMLKKREIQDNL